MSKNLAPFRKSLEKELAEMERLKAELPVRIKVTRHLITSLEAWEAASNGEPKPKGKFLCPDCQKSFQNPSGLGSHRSRVHGVKGKTRGSKTTANR